MRHQIVVGALGLCALAGLVAPQATHAPPRLIWNVTASAPVGLYRLSRVDALQVGDWIALRPAEPLAGWLDRAGYLPHGALLIKQVAALPPSRVCRLGDLVTVNGAPAARAVAHDRWGRRLPIWGGCRTLRPSDVFLINGAAGSLDGRYLGASPRSAVVGRLAPVLLIGGAASDA